MSVVLIGSMITVEVGTEVLKLSVGRVTVIPGTPSGRDGEIPPC